MAKSIDRIIQYLILEKRSTIIVKKTSLTFSNKIDNKFLLKLEEDSNIITTKT